MKDLKTIKKELRDHLLEGIDEPIEELKQLLPEQGEKYESIILWESQLRELEREEMRGTISDEASMLRRNRLRQSIIDFINDLEEKDFEEALEEELIKASSKKPKFKIWLLAIPAILSVLLLVFILPKGSDIDPEPPDDKEDPQPIVDSCSNILSEFQLATYDTSLWYLIISADSSYILTATDTIVELSAVDTVDLLSARSYWKINTNGSGRYQIISSANRKQLNLDKQDGFRFTDPKISNYSWQFPSKANLQEEVYFYASSRDSAISINVQQATFFEVNCLDKIIKKKGMAWQIIGFLPPQKRYTIRSKKEFALALQNRNNKFIRALRVKDEGKISSDLKWEVRLHEWENLQPIWRLISVKDTNRLIRSAVNKDNSAEVLNVLPRDRRERILVEEQKDVFLIPEAGRTGYYTIQSRHRWGNQDFYLELLEWKEGKAKLSVQMTNKYKTGDHLKLWRFSLVND